MPATQRIDLQPGETYHSWTVLAYSHNGNTGAEYVCRCKCGHTRTIPGNRLRKGRTKQCSACAKHGTRPTKPKPKAEKPKAPPKPTWKPRTNTKSFGLADKISKLPYTPDGDKEVLALLEARATIGPDLTRYLIRELHKRPTIYTEVSRILLKEQREQMAKR